MAEEEYLTIKEAAGRLRRHWSTVYRWTVEGKIAYHQPYANAMILIPLSAIERALKQPPNGN